MPTDDFFDRVLPWSHWKHRILDKYLHVFVAKLSSRSPLLAFIDACAGEGVYATGEEGSPVIAARWNDQFLRPRGKRLVVIAVEQRAAAAARLRDVMRPWTDRTPAEAVVVEASFVDAMPELLDVTRGVPTFVFVDPYGMRSIRADELRPLLDDEDRDSTELLLRVDPGLLARASGWLAPKARSASGQKTADSFRRFLERCNVRPEVLDQFASQEPLGMRGGRDAVLLAEYLRLFTDRFRYVQLIPIRPSYYAAPKYLLVHGTDSPDGAAKINDAVSTTEDELFTDTATAEDRRRGQSSLFDPPPRVPRVSIEHAKAYVLEFLGDRRARRFVEISAALAMRFGPDLREKHHRAAVRDLLNSSRLTRLSAGRAIEEGTRVRLA
jgi:three-Cys-motif partner protein